jgi:polar amino acid transport system substrate-binding protein
MTRSVTTRAAASGLAALTALVLVAGCSQPDGSWERVQQAGVLRVGLDPTYPPFALIEGSDLSGADVDLARALAADLGVEAQFTYFGYDGLYDGLATGLVDVLISGLVVVPDKMEDFAYSDAYYDAGQVLVVPATGAPVAGMKDLSGKRLAVELGSPGHMEAGRWERRLPSLSVLPFNDPDAALEAVAGGAADAALVDSTSARLHAGRGAPLQVLSPTVVPEPFVMVVRIEDRALLDRLNSALSRLQAGGGLESIYKDWLER